MDDNYIAVVFPSDNEAFDALHELWSLDVHGDITVHGAAVVHRDLSGHFDVATKRTDPGIRTLVGVAVGTLIGMLAGPAGAAIGAARGAGIGAAAGGVLGVTADAVKSGEHEEAAYEGGLLVKPGESAVIAEVSEDWTAPIDTAMKKLGGKVTRRSKGTVRENSLWGENYYPYLYPYDYNPYFWPM